MVPRAWIQSWGGDRNDGMLFNWINFVFAMNMFANALWLPFFQLNKWWGFLISWVIINGMWWSAMSILVIVERTDLYWLEAMIYRIPFSIYGGWLTCALVLNAFYFAKSIGFTDDPQNPRQDGINWINEDTNWVSEEQSTISVLWFVEVWFEIYMWWERNPLYGIVFTWASTAILYKNVSEEKGNTALVSSLGAEDSLHTFSVIVLTCYLIFEELQPWYNPISFWKGGLFGQVDWSMFFTDMKAVLSYPE